MRSEKCFGKQRFRPAGLGFAVVLLCVMVWSCPYIRSRDSLRDPTYTGQIKKIFVHVVDRTPVVGGSHPTVGGVLEDQLVERLEEHGVAAIAGYRFLSESEVISREDIARVIADKGVDGVFIAGPTNREKLESLQPGEISYASGLLEDRTMDRDRFSAFVKGSLKSSGTYAGKKILMELAVYDVKQGRRIWSTLSKTRIWDTPEDAVKPMAAEIIRTLADQKIIP